MTASARESTEGAGEVLGRGAGRSLPQIRASAALRVTAPGDDTRTIRGAHGYQPAAHREELRMTNDDLVVRWLGLPDFEPPHTDSEGMPIPPDSLLVGYADSADVYLSSGALHVGAMNEKLGASGYELASAKSILDLGSGIGRMIRHLPGYNPTAVMWGVDISAIHIQWCKDHLSPPFHFAVTTPLPALPFPDGFFDVVYAGSVFTHIGDLADAWLLELRRVMSPGGRAYVTLHDDDTVALLESHPVYKQMWLSEQLRSAPGYQVNKSSYGMLVIGPDDNCQVFYRRAYFERMLTPSFEILGVHPETHGYQTAYVIHPK